MTLLRLNIQAIGNRLYKTKLIGYLLLVGVCKLSAEKVRKIITKYSVVKDVACPKKESHFPSYRHHPNTERNLPESGHYFTID